MIILIKIISVPVVVAVTLGMMTTPLTHCAPGMEAATWWQSSEGIVDGERSDIGEEEEEDVENVVGDVVDAEVESGKGSPTNTFVVPNTTPYGEQFCVDSATGRESQYRKRRPKEKSGLVRRFIISGNCR